MNIAQARRLAVAPDDDVVVAALDAPLVVARSRPGLRVVALSFDPRRSDLPLRPAFPLLLGNAFDWLALGQSDGAQRASHVTGSRARLALPPGSVSATVVEPGGKRGVRRLVDGALELPLPRSGFYRVEAAPAGAAPVTVAASFLAPAESNTSAQGAPGAPAAPRAAPASPARGPDLTTWVLLLACALCLLEWLGHLRRWIF
jgi:hypothetical protein